MITDIYITMSREQIKQRGYRNIICEMMGCDGDPLLYYWKLSGKPKHEIDKVYVVAGNRVRFVGKVLEVAGAGWMDFGEDIMTYAKAWLVTFGYKHLPRPYEHKKGFQGIRYKL